MQSTKEAVFSLGEYDYAFDIKDVKIIEEVIPIEPVANLPKNLKGIIKLRGDVIPVYSLRRKFGLQDIPEDDETRFIISSCNDMLVAFEVDQMKEIIELEPELMNEMPSIFINKDISFMKKVTNVDGRLIIILDPRGILSEEENNKVKALIKK